MNFLDLNNDGKRDTKDGQIILAYIFAAEHCRHAEEE
jgi:hypothetical protein